MGGEWVGHPTGVGWVGGASPTHLPLPTCLTFPYPHLKHGGVGEAGGGGRICGAGFGDRIDDGFGDGGDGLKPSLTRCPAGKWRLRWSASGEAEQTDRGTGTTGPAGAGEGRPERHGTDPIPLPQPSPFPHYLGNFTPAIFHKIGKKKKAAF